MQMYDRRHETEAEAVARRIAARIGAIEPLEDFFPLERVHPRPRVPHGAEKTCPVLLQRQRDAPPLRAELDRVVDEVGEGLEQKVTVALQHRVLGLERERN